MTVARKARDDADALPIQANGKSAGGHFNPGGNSGGRVGRGVIGG